MAKTNWQMGDTVLPEDLNRMGQEINDSAAAIANHKSAAVLDHPDGSVTMAKLANGAVTDAKIGNRTISDSTVPAGDTGSPTNLWSWLAYMIKSITGKSNWRTVPATTLEAAKAHMDSTTGIHGATSAATPNRIVIRDVNGRFKATAPVESDDVARKAEVDAMLPKTGGELSGNVIFANERGIFGRDANNVPQAIGIVGSNNQVMLGDPDVETNIRGTAVKINGYTAWHAGNDGAGSGLDADMLDGIQSERFIYGDNARATIEYNGNLDNVSKSGFYYAATGHTNSPTGANGEFIHVQRGSNAAQALQIFLPFNSDTLYFRKKNNDWGSWNKLVQFNVGTNKIYASGEYAGVRANANQGTNVEFDGHISGVRRGLLSINENQVEMRKYAGDGTTIEKRLTLTSADAFIDGGKIWHAGNVPYETGSWTPSLRFGSSSAGISYSSRTGRYTRIGNVVFWSFEINLTSKGTAQGQAIVDGLPFKIGTGLVPTVVVAKFTRCSFSDGTAISLQGAMNATYMTFYMLITGYHGGNIMHDAFKDDTSVSAQGFYYLN